MALLLLEALGALALLLFIVWWTMFSGRKNGELPGEPPEDGAQKTADTSTGAAGAAGEVGAAEGHSHEAPPSDKGKPVR